MKITFSSFSSLESEKAGNISSYFSMANWNTDTVTESPRRYKASSTCWQKLDDLCYLCIQLIHDEVAQWGFEEILLSVIFQERIVHSAHSNLGVKKKNHKYSKKETWEIFSSFKWFYFLLFSVWSLWYLFINFNSFLVLLQLSAVVSNLQETLVGWAETHIKIETQSLRANWNDGCCIRLTTQNGRSSALHFSGQQKLWFWIICFPWKQIPWHKINVEND